MESLRVARGGRSGGGGARDHPHGFSSKLRGLGGGRGSASGKRCWPQEPPTQVEGCGRRHWLLSGRPEQCDPAMVQRRGAAAESARRSNERYETCRPRPLRKCAIVVDRHVHKNGGSTVRDLFLEHERLGMALYQGYTQMYWNRDFKFLKAAADAAKERGATPEHVVLVEAHFGWVEMASQVMPSLRQLERQYRRAGADCPIVTMTRVREPLEYYLSFYRWGVAYRQRADPVSFGSSFLEWVERVPNLQSVTMMQSMAAMAAEYHVHQFKMHYSRSSAIGRTDEVAWERLTAFWTPSRSSAR